MLHISILIGELHTIYGSRPGNGMTGLTAPAAGAEDEKDEVDAADVLELAS